MIAAIEAAMVARIQAASDDDVLGYKLRTVGSYGGELDEELSKIALQFPAAWVVFAGERISEKGGGRHRAEANFVVIVAAKNYRNEKATRHGAAGEVGSYQLITDVKALFIERNLGLEIDAFKPVAVRSLFSGKLRTSSASIFAVEFRTAYVMEAVPDAGEAESIGSFKHFHADWDIPPHAEHESVPLDPEDADATDDLELTGA